MKLKLWNPALVLLMGLLLVPAIKGHTAQHHTSPLKFCQNIVSQLKPEQHHMLRDGFQELHYHVRIVREADLILSRQQRPTEEKDVKAWEAAYKLPRGNMTVESMAGKRSAADAQVNLMTKKLQLELDNLKKSNVVASAVSLNSLIPCVMHQVNPHLFKEQPVVTFMLQYFKRPWAVEKLVERTASCRAVVPCELVVNVDNPDEHAQWANLSWSSNGFVVPVLSANIHEARSFNRLSQLARGKYLVILQDDEFLQSDCLWLRDVVGMFQRWPQVGIIGHRGYLWGYGPNYTNRGTWYKDPTTQIPMQFVFNADYAPMSVRRSALIEIGGVDEGLMEAGECGIGSDWELTTRMWKGGWRVAYMPIPDRDRDEGHDSGTHKPETGERCWGKQGRLSGAMYWNRHGEWNEAGSLALAAHVKELNTQLLLPFDPARFMKACPYAADCKTE